MIYSRKRFEELYNKIEEDLVFPRKTIDELKDLIEDMLETIEGLQATIILSGSPKIEKEFHKALEQSEGNFTPVVDEFWTYP